MHEIRRQEQRAPLSPLVFHRGKINSIYKLQLHSLLSMLSMHHVSSHNPWSIGNASFESQGTTSTRDQPMARASFQYSRYVQLFHLFYSAHLHLVTLKVRVGCCSLVYSRAKVDMCIISYSLCIRRCHNTTLHCHFWVC